MRYETQLMWIRIRHKRWYVEEGAPDPLLGAGAAVIDAISACISDIQDCKRSIVQAAKTTSTVKIDMGPTSKSEEVNHSVGRPIARLARELAVETATCTSQTQQRLFNDPN